MTAIPDSLRRVIEPWTVFEPFDTISATRGRAGDLDPAKWMGYAFNPDANITPTANHVRPATIPTCRAGITSPVYTPDNFLICDNTSSLPSSLMMACIIQEYGVDGIMYRRPADWSGRTLVIEVDVDVWANGVLGTYVNLNITNEPVPATTPGILQNQEPGARSDKAVLIQFSGGDETRNTVGAVLTYDGFTKTEVTPSFSVSGTDRLLVAHDNYNHLQIRMSTTNLQVWGSDYSTDGGRTFPNFRKIYDAPLALTFTRGYIHIQIRNHSTTKFDLQQGDSGQPDMDNTGIYHFRNFRFNGRLMPVPRAYEIPHNTTTGHNSSPPVGEDEYDYRRMGYQVSDGSGRAEGIWNAADSPANISPLTFTGSVNISGITTATLTLNVFVNAISNTATTSWGLKYKFNGGTWRTRTLTAAEVSMLNTDLGSAGNLALAIDVPVGDVASGTNTIDFSTVSVPMDFAPVVSNIDLLVAA